MSKYSRVVNPGDRFGRLTVQGFAPASADGRPMLLCKCDCGVERRVQKSNLVTGNTTSCGCLRVQAVSQSQKKRWRQLNSRPL